jgi:thioesterase domain-containing protein
VDMSTQNDLSSAPQNLQFMQGAERREFDPVNTSELGVGNGSHQVAVVTVSDPVEVVRTLASIEEIVTEAWEEVLGRRPIARDTDYWELGRGAMAALRILERIEDKTGVLLPVSVLYEASTIARLAKWIYEGKTATFSRLVRLKPGVADEPPLFIVSGISGIVMELVPVGRAISYAGTVYALQAKGLGDNETPDDSIEEMATHYLEVIRGVQPRGPYLLCGYSIGGYVAIEMARQLEAQEEPVPFLGLLDSHPFEAYWPFHIWLVFMIQYSVRTVWQNLHKYIRRKSPRQTNELPAERTVSDSSSSSPMGERPSSKSETFKWIIHSLQRFTIRFRNPRGHAFGKRFSYYTEGLPTGLQRVLENGFILVGEYRPRFFEKEIFFFKSELGDRAQCDPLKVWPKYFPHLNVQQVPGDHRSMLYGTNAGSLAREISNCISSST